MLLHKIRFKKKQPNSICHLDVATWIFLSDLIAHGYPFMDALTFLNVDTSRLHTHLQQGQDILELLLKEEKGRFYEHLRFFISIMSLSDAIQSAKALASFEKELKTKFLKKSIYPICILLFAYVMLWVFSSAIIPQMMNSFSMDNDFKSLALLVAIMKIFCVLFALFTLCLLTFYAYLKFHPELRSRLLYRYVSYIHLLKDYESYMLAGYLLEMQKRGISTKHAFQFLIHVDMNSVFHLMASSIQLKLVKGEDYLSILSHHPMLNDSFAMAFKVGATSSNLETMLTTFMKQQEHIWDQSMKKISVILQIISYSFVGFVVLIVYQIMLVPLSMLEHM